MTENFEKYINTKYRVSLILHFSGQHLDLFVCWTFPICCQDENKFEVSSNTFRCLYGVFTDYITYATDFFHQSRVSSKIDFSRFIKLLSVFVYLSASLRALMTVRIKMTEIQTELSICFVMEMKILILRCIKWLQVRHSWYWCRNFSDMFPRITEIFDWIAPYEHASLWKKERTHGQLLTQDMDTWEVVVKMNEKASDAHVCEKLLMISKSCSNVDSLHARSYRTILANRQMTIQYTILRSVRLSIGFWD